MSQISEKVGRNDLCPCGSGKKYKKCCLENLADGVQDFAWRRLRLVESELVDQHLIPFAMKRLPATTTEKVFADLAGELPEGVDKSLLFTTFFIPWLLYSWVPTADLALGELAAGKPIVLQYCEKFSNKLSQEQKRFIAALGEIYYSFYEVVEVIPEQAIVLQDLLVGNQFSIKERQGTSVINPGDILFTRILTLDEQSIFIGLAPLLIPAVHRDELIKLRDEIINKQGEGIKTISGQNLRDHFERDLIAHFFAIVRVAFKQPLPDLEHQSKTNQ